MLLLPAGSRYKYHTTSEGCPEVVGARDRGTLGQFGCPIAAIRAFLVDCTRILAEIVIVARTASINTPSFPAAATYGILRHELAFAPNPPDAERHAMFQEAHSVSDTNLSSFIWSIAELLRNDYKQSEYGKVILPFTLLRRLDQVLEPTKDAVLETAGQDIPEAMREHLLTQAAGSMVYNTSRFTFDKLLGDADHLQSNLLDYLNGFSPAARDIFEKYDFHNQIARLDAANLLFLVLQRFNEVDLSPERVSNADMGTVFEELIRRFAELSNETAGHHFTPREVIRLMVHLLFHDDDLVLRGEGTVRTLYDPCAGTGGMLSIADEYIADHNPTHSLRSSARR